HAPRLINAADSADWVLHQLVVLHVRVVQTAVPEVLLGRLHKQFAAILGLLAKGVDVKAALLVENAVQGLVQRAHGCHSVDWVSVSPHNSGVWKSRLDALNPQQVARALECPSFARLRSALSYLP